MARQRFTLVTVAAMVLAAMVLAACGTSYSAGSSAGSAGSEAGEGSKGQTSDPPTAMEIAGIGNVLTNADGLTLYYLETDAHREVTCTGDCAETWPPSLVSGTPGATSLPGQLGTIENPAGQTQLTYDGWPLYTYAGDAAPGDANGEGVGGVWFAMTADGPRAASGASGPAGEGYGY